MKPKQSAGLLMFRVAGDVLEVLLAHPGGPYFEHRDAGVWTIPKGEIDPHEDALDAAIREFQEETGLQPSGPFLELGSITQKGGKRVQAWAFEGDCDPSAATSNTVMLEWPPGSSRFQAYPEVDRVAFFSVGATIGRINPAQQPLVDALVARVGEVGDRRSTSRF